MNSNLIYGKSNACTIYHVANFLPRFGTLKSTDTMMYKTELHSPS